jgi:hypothetical protein
MYVQFVLKHWLHKTTRPQITVVVVQIVLWVQSVGGRQPIYYRFYAWPWSSLPALTVRAPEEIPLPYEFMWSRELLAQLKMKYRIKESKPQPPSTMSFIGSWSSKVEIRKTVKIISWFGKRGAWKLCNVFRDGVDEMIRNASCFVISFPRNNYLHFPTEASKSKSLVQ